MSTSPSSVAWNWRALPEARVPGAALAFGQAARRLLARLSKTDPERRQGWTVTAADDVLVVFGAAAQLPWAEGVRYAAPHPDARALWLPTNEEPSAPVDLVMAALSRATGRAPLLLWPAPTRVMPLDRQLAASNEVLQSIAEKWQAAPGQAS
jgi:hypothetical protein